MFFMALIWAEVKKCDILNMLFNADISFSYVASIFSLLFPCRIYVSPNRRCPSCFKISIALHQPWWYFPLLSLLMDSRLAPWNGHAKLKSLWNNCWKNTFTNITSQGTLLQGVWHCNILLEIKFTFSKVCEVWAYHL